MHAGQPDDDGLPDFLVNDVPDPDDLPDTIHSSDGTVLAVAAVTGGSTDGPPTPGDLEVQLTASMPAGWAYLRMPEPGEDDYLLSRVARADGSRVPVDNAWMTHRTHRPLDEPAYREHLLHLLDFNGAGLRSECDVDGPHAAAKLREHPRAWERRRRPWPKPKRPSRSSGRFPATLPWTAPSTSSI